MLESCPFKKDERGVNERCNSNCKLRSGEHCTFEWVEYLGDISVSLAIIAKAAATPAYFTGKKE